jgi:3-oxoacyl-[acyl-carrier-protein] synthase-3
MNLRIASTAYAVPPTEETVEAIMKREWARVEAALRPLSPALRTRVETGLGLERVRICDRVTPYGLVFEAATNALAGAGMDPRDLDLIVDFSTLPGETGQHLSLAFKLAAELKTEVTLSFGFKVGGCGGLHLALKTAAALMQSNDDIRHALLVTADSPPPGSRSLLPVTVQGDGAGAVVLSKSEGPGARVLDTEVVTLGHLHDVISIDHAGSGRNGLVIHVDAARIENEVAPIYYLNFYRLVHKVLERAAIRLEDVDHFIYSNISEADRDGFSRSLKIPTGKAPYTRLADYGHTFAADLIINYTDLLKQGRIRPGQILLFASAGIGFTWGVTLARV